MVKPDSEQSAEQKILDAARRVFFKKGYGGARMQDIADEAGINKALLHYYFRSKEKLFEVIFAEAFGKLLPKLQEIFTSEQSLFDKIRAFTDAYISLLMEHPFVPMFVLNAMHSDPESFTSRYLGQAHLPVQQLRNSIKQALDQGLIVPTDPLQLMLNTISLCIFPFIGKPMFQVLTGISEKQYQQIMDKRKKEVAEFIIQSIRI